MYELNERDNAMDLMGLEYKDKNMLNAAVTDKETDERMRKEYYEKCNKKKGIFSIFRKK